MEILIAKIMLNLTLHSREPDLVKRTQMGFLYFGSNLNNTLHYLVAEVFVLSELCFEV